MKKNRVLFFISVCQKQSSDTITSQEYERVYARTHKHTPCVKINTIYFAYHYYAQIGITANFSSYQSLFIYFIYVYSNSLVLHSFTRMKQENINNKTESHTPGSTNSLNRIRADNTRHTDKHEPNAFGGKRLCAVD